MAEQGTQVQNPSGIDSKSAEIAANIVHANSHANFYNKNKISKLTKDNKDIIQLEHHLKDTVSQIIHVWQSIFWPTLAQAEKDYQMYTGDRAIQLREAGQPWRSNECIPIVRTYVDTMHSNFF
jgi:hypothetical protein